MNRPTGLNILLYIRKSRSDIEEEKKAQEQGVHYDTLERHRKRLLAIAKAEGHNILDIFEEVVSGENIAERPSMQLLLRMVEDGKTDGVLVIDLDRLGRGDMLDQGMIDRAFRYSGTLILTPTDVYDPNDESWELIFSIKSIISRQELKAINKRLYHGRMDSVKEGKHIGKKPPFGYQRDETLKLTPDPETAWIVKKIFEWSVEGKGRRVICDELNKLEIPPPAGKGKVWNITSIRNIAQNEVYQGDLVWRKSKHVKRNGKYIKRDIPKEEWIIVENAHEGIVSKELFQKANESINARYIPPMREPRKLVNALAGILRCEVCGQAMWRNAARYRKKTGEQSAYMICQNQECKRLKRTKMAPYIRVERAVIQALEDWVESMEIEGRLPKQKNKNDSLLPVKENVMTQKRKELLELETQRDNIHDLLEKGVYTIEKFMERQQIITERMGNIKEDIQSLEADIEKEKRKKKTSKEILPVVKNAIVAYKQTDDISKKNRLLKSILEKATYYRSPDSTHPDDFTIKLYPKL